MALIYNPVPSEAAEVDAVQEEVQIINLGTKWSNGENVLMFSSAVTPKRLDMRNGTAASPVEAVGPTAKVSRKEALTVAAIEAVGGAGTDGADVVAAFQGISEGQAASQTQTVGVYAGAKNKSTFTEGNPDACGLYAIGNITGGTAAKATGIGATVIGRRESGVTADLSGIELVSHNRASAGSYTAAGASDTKGLWITAAGTAVSGVAVQVGNPNSLPFKVGYAVNSQNGGAVSEAAFRDDSEAAVSLDIRGKHATAAVTTAKEAGPVIINAQALTTTTTQLLELAAQNTARNPMIKLTGGGNVAQTIVINNSAANVTLGQSGGAGQLMTGTANGDGVLIIGNAQVLHIGRSAAVADLKVGGGLGFFGTAPQAKPEVTGSRATGAALTSLLEKLATIGLITNGSTA